MSHRVSDCVSTRYPVVSAMRRGDVVDSQVSEWLTISEACEFFKVSKRTLYRWMVDDQVPYYFIGAGAGPRRFRLRDLENMMEPMGAAEQVN